MKTKLYSDLAPLYDSMYQTFINYDEEYLFYKNLIAPFYPKSVLEIGCGTGQLASRFQQNGQNTEQQRNPDSIGTEGGYLDYCGLDFSEDMLKIARKRSPNTDFRQGDMTRLKLEKTFDAVLITGRTLSYITKNKALMDTFKGVHKTLNREGVLIFDVIDAFDFIKKMDEKEVVTHQATHENTHFKRESCYKKNLKEGWTWDWTSTFFTENQGVFSEIAHDKATLRAFLEQEIRLFLELCGFEVKNVLRQKTYAFETLVFTVTRTTRP
jgi:ubiquinone/menaquinone biosynthesis C-methylase UbiE